MADQLTPAKKPVQHIRRIVLTVLGGFFAASFPWMFILLLPGAAGFYLFQPVALMFVTYPAIYVAVGLLTRLFGIQPLRMLPVCFLAFALVISQAIAWAAALYFGFYLVFFMIGYWVMGLALARREKPTRPS